ncbi:hypothetical protein U6G28_00920 [Actinomycetaceae bacterium MB13-C1-2]|nr:hypothetical protein U6G28_00920 [Actinomycetaceae bacterium MB13-C1-2]
MFWSDLPPLTVLASAPGWGKTIWMMQCAETVGDDKTEWVHGLHKLHKVVAEIEQLKGAPKDTVYLIDGIESALSENPALWEQILAIAEVGSVVVACYCVPVSIIPLATVLDERHLAFDRAELEQIAAHLVADSAVLDMFVLPESMRGCPWIVGRDVARIRARSTGYSRVISELSSSALCYKSFRDNPGFMESGAGRALVAAGGLPIVTEALLASVASDIDIRYCYARMSAWPVFDEVVDDESGEDALRWAPDAWKMMQETASKEEQRSVLEAGLRAEVDRGSILGEARALLMLGRLIEAERLAERRLRRLLLFASPDCARLLSETVSDFSNYPALAILFSEIQTWELGNTEATKARSLRAARSVAMRKATGLFDEFARASMVAFGAVSGGDRLLAGRFLDHVLELLGDFDPSSEDVDKDARQALSGQLYLSYWVAIQLDRHEDALTLANSIVTVGNPSDRIMPMERVCAATQMDLGGFTSLSGSKPPHPDDPISNAVALRDLEDADDQVAVSRLRAIINHPDPLPSRSAIDGLVLLVRGIADPQELLVSQVDAAVERSSFLWGGGGDSQQLCCPRCNGLLRQSRGTDQGL